ncbi:MAG: hypothetical protein QM767_23755 [Anaeromyxobacter sp.]
MRLPRISNHDELDPLEHEPGVVLRFVERPEELAGADLVILPGSKATAADLAWLRASGLADAVMSRAGRGDLVLGICGGFQMLGRALLDPDGVEGQEPEVPGLGLLPVVTTFRREKTTARVLGALEPSALFAAGAARGYEIHMGEVQRLEGAPPALRLTARNGEPCDIEDGAVSPGGAVVGTLVHGLLEDDAVRAGLLARLRARRGLPAPASPPVATREEEYDRLADALAAHLDWTLLCSAAGLPALPRPGART